MNEFEAVVVVVSSITPLLQLSALLVCSHQKLLKQHLQKQPGCKGSHGGGHTIYTLLAQHWRLRVISSEAGMWRTDLLRAGRAAAIVHFRVVNV